MKLWAIGVSLVLAAAGVGLFDSSAEAAITPAQRKEITELKKDITKAGTHISKDELPEAGKILSSVEEKLRKIATDAKVPETDRALLPVFKLVATKKALLGKKQGSDPNAIDFNKDVATVLAKKCVSCHGQNRSSGGLRLDNFAGMETGGAGGALLVVGNAAASNLVIRISGGNNRMPRGAAPLSPAEINSIATWINQGAKFEGDKQAQFSDLPPAATPAAGTPATAVAMATGADKVSFVRDIAPFMVNLCVRCHSGNTPRGGLSLNTFDELMRGGKNGRIILPGNRDGSMLWILVGDPNSANNKLGVRMPQGQGRITRKNWEDLRTWLDEGAKFDGPDPKAPLASMVKTDEEIAAERLAKLSPEDFAKYRLTRTEEQWKEANPREPGRYAETKDFFIYGNVDEERLKQLVEWSDEHVKQLRTIFGTKADPIWKGKLTVFVFKDRFTFEEFPRVVNGAEIPAETTGMSRVVPSYEDAYIALQDIGDEVTSESPGLKVNLIDHMTGAFLKRSGTQIPDWVLRGTGLAMAASKDPKNVYLLNLQEMALGSTKGLQRPADIFANGTFSSADIGPVGFTLVAHMLQAGAPNYGRFVTQLQSGGDLTGALRTVYQTDMNGLATSYFGSLASNQKPGKKR